MITGKCPKCSSSVILKSKRGGWPGLHQINIKVTAVAYVECLICADCGFVETYVPSEKEREKMLTHFDRYEVRA